MEKLINIEFFNAPNGDVMVNDAYGLWTLREENRDFILTMYQYIEENHSEAFKYLQAEYKASRPNVSHYQFLIVHRFLRCTCGKLDRKLDFSDNSKLNPEEVDCPMAGECKGYNVLCNLKFDTDLTTRQRQVMKLYMDNVSDDEIADRLRISPDTARTTKRDAFRKTGCHSMVEFITKFNGKL